MSNWRNCLQKLDSCVLVLILLQKVWIRSCDTNLISTLSLATSHSSPKPFVYHLPLSPEGLKHHGTSGTVASKQQPFSVHCSAVMPAEVASHLFLAWTSIRHWHASVWKELLHLEQPYLPLHCKVTKCGVDSWCVTL